MKAWLAELMLGALKIAWVSAYKWLLDPDRHARIRFRHRERWWKYYQRALETKSGLDDMLAEAWRIEYDFKTPPAVAKARGDLDPEARKIASDAMERNRNAHGNHP